MGNLLFSERTGLKPIKTTIQVDSMDLDLRNGLWNCLNLCYWSHVNSGNYRDPLNANLRGLISKFWLHYFKAPIDTIPYLWPDVISSIRGYFFKASWNEVYDFIEFIVKNYDEEYSNKRFIPSCNAILKREVSAYRFVEKEIIKMTTEEEIATIEDALNTSTPLAPVHAHLKTALDFLSDRKSPNYRNSVKESISAVEALSRLLTSDKKATLGQALKRLKDNKIDLHPALEASFNSMYGYASDESGVRHSLLEKSELQFSDAKLMLVSCSAFINYLIDKAIEAGIKLI